MRNIIVALAVCVLLSGCATPRDAWDGFLGVSIKEIETSRADALMKVFDYDYKTCYEKTEALLRKMPNVSVYRQDDSMIAIYLITPNTTPVGIFFTEVDSAHTQVEISSPSTPAKEWVAKNIFSEKVQDQEKVGIKL